MNLEKLYTVKNLAEQLAEIRSNIRIVRDPKSYTFYCSIAGRQMPNAATDAARDSVLRWLEKQERDLESELHTLGVYNTRNPNVRTQDEPIQAPADGA